MDKKEQILLDIYRDKFNNNSFIEPDIYGFLILIRNYIKQYPQEYKYIIEFSDLVAHRKRDRGIAMEQISQMIKVKYKTNPDNTVKGFSGINECDWQKEWKLLNKKLKLSLSDKNINEITMCIYSLAQDTIYIEEKNKKNNSVRHRGYVKLFFDDCNNVYLVCTAGRKKSKYVAFAKSKNYISNVEEKGIMDEAVVLVRDNNCNLIQIKK